MICPSKNSHFPGSRFCESEKLIFSDFFIKIVAFKNYFDILLSESKRLFITIDWHI